LFSSHNLLPNNKKAAPLRHAYACVAKERLSSALPLNSKRLWH